MSGRRRSHRHIAPLRIALAMPALLMQLTAPLSAAAPGLHLIPMCTAEGPRLVAIGGEDPATPPADHDRQGGMTCAHALCPRELLPGRKARAGI